MNDSATYRIPGRPVAQGRPRFYRVGAGIRAVDPMASRKWKEKARRAFVAESAQLMEGPLSVNVTSVFPLPQKDYSKMKQKKFIFHDKRPDLDNLVKAVLDAGNGVLYADDCKVVMLSARKVYVPGEEYVEVTVAKVVQ